MVSPTPPEEESSSIVFLKGLNAFTQLFDMEGNKVDEEPKTEKSQESEKGEINKTKSDKEDQLPVSNELNEDDNNDVIIS